MRLRCVVQDAHCSRVQDSDTEDSDNGSDDDDDDNYDTAHAPASAVTDMSQGVAGDAMHPPPGGPSDVRSPPKRMLRLSSPRLSASLIYDMQHRAPYLASDLCLLLDSAKLDFYKT